jgi:hypothetical protein
VDATPSVFINGRRVHEFNYAVLKALIDYVLESHAVRQFQIRAQYKGNTVKALVLKDGAIK